MLSARLPRLRFRLKSIFILMLGVAIGYSLNLATWRLLTGPGSEARKLAMPTYTIEPPDILLIDVSKEAAGPSVISGQHLVAMDGRVNLGALGSAYVAGMTIAEAQDSIKCLVARKIDSPRVVVDVLAYNSKCYYIVVRGQGGRDDVVRAPVTGNETALDAIAVIGGLEAPDAAEIWISRPAPNGVGSEQILPVDWKDISRVAATMTNYQILPGDRVFISMKPTTSPTK